MEGRVVRICVAPVKALHVLNPDEVELTHAGVVGDRRFWLVDASRRLVNGKRHPELMRVRAEWDGLTGVGYLCGALSLIWLLTRPPSGGTLQVSPDAVVRPTQGLGRQPSLPPAAGRGSAHRDRSAEPAEHR